MSEPMGESELQEIERNMLPTDDAYYWHMCRRLIAEVRRLQALLATEKEEFGFFGGHVDMWWREFQLLLRDCQMPFDQSAWVPQTQAVRVYVKDLCVKIERLEALLADKDRQLAESRACAAACQQRIYELATERNVAAEQLAAYKAQCERDSSLFKSINEENDRLAPENELLREQLADKDAVIESQMTRGDEYKLECEQLREQLAEEKRRTDQLHAAVAELRFGRTSASAVQLVAGEPESVKTGNPDDQCAKCPHTRYDHDDGVDGCCVECDCQSFVLDDSVEAEPQASEATDIHRRLIDDECGETAQMLAAKPAAEPKGERYSVTVIKTPAFTTWYVADDSENDWAEFAIEQRAREYAALLNARGT